MTLNETKCASAQLKYAAALKDVASTAKQVALRLVKKKKWSLKDKSGWQNNNNIIHKFKGSLQLNKSE